MRKLTCVFNVFCVLLLLAGGCQKDSGSVTFEVSASSVALTNSTRETKFTITTDQEWDISNIPAWCTVKPESGAGDASVVISATVSLEMSEREAEIVVSAGKATRVIRVVQSPAAFKMTPEQLVFKGGGEMKILTILSDTEWSVTLLESIEGCTVSPMNGNGNATLEVTIPENPVHVQREATINVRVGKISMPLMVRQEARENGIPSFPELMAPSSGATNVSLLPEFSWRASIDPDGDPVSYELQISVDQEMWIAAPVMKTIACRLPEPLTMETVYFWRVVAKDEFGGRKSSDVKSFTTTASGAYRDGEVRAFQLASAGKGIDIVFLGDGFIPADYADDGVFDQILDEGIEALFDVEPFKTYRNYFNVYKVAAYSKERGASEADKGIVKNTAFSSRYLGASHIDTDREKVGNYSRKIPGMTDSKFQVLTMILVVNDTRFAGTTYMTTGGRTIAVCPVNREELPRGYKNLIVHEGGGHAFGLLGDEYVDNQTEIPEQELAQIKELMTRGFYANLDYTADRKQVKWKHFFNRPGYGRVGVFEGGYYYRRGLWHSEGTSCMINNMSYYNAPSREAIVRRLKTLAGEAFSFDDFVAKDLTKAPSETRGQRSSLTLGRDFRMVSPVIVNDF